MLHRSAFSSDSDCRTQMHLARRGQVSPEMARVAEREELSAAQIREEVARGRMIIPANVHHAALDPMAIGLRARVKVNANIGNSPTTSSLAEEVEKLTLSEKWGADTVMDLSTGKRIDETREAIVEAATVPIGTVPIYQAVEQVKAPEDLTGDLLVKNIEHQARQGVDYMTIHAGVRLEHLPLCQHRVTGIVSRGGGLLARWMVHHRRENPLYERFDDILEICRAPRSWGLLHREPPARPLPPSARPGGEGLAARQPVESARARAVSDDLLDVRHARRWLWRARAHTASVGAGGELTPLRRLKTHPTENSGLPRAPVSRREMSVRELEECRTHPNAVRELGRPA